MMKNLLRILIKIMKPFRFILRGILSLFLFLILYPLRSIFRIKFVELFDMRVGHLAANTYLFLMRKKLKLIDTSLRYVGIASKNPSNEQLLRMFQRNMKIIRLPSLFYRGLLFIDITNSYLMKKFDIFEYLIFEHKEYNELKHRGKSLLAFTYEEKKKGEDLLKSMGIGKKDWYVCFHVRDKAYLSNVAYSKDTSMHDFRDCDINKALKAVEYITSKGGYALRIGAIVEKKLAIKNSKIIDYATKYRTDFGDIYLTANCRFFLGTGAGINQVAQVFYTPVAWFNIIPMQLLPFDKGDIFIIKKLWNIKEKRLLKFSEMLSFEESIREKTGTAYPFTQDYANAGLKVIDNSEDEILDVTVEMYERLEGNWVETEEDKLLQKKYKSLFKKGSHCYGFPSRIGAMFLRKNKNLLD